MADTSPFRALRESNRAIGMTGLCWFFIILPFLFAFLGQR